jgi:hypothetical protein
MLIRNPWRNILPVFLIFTVTWPLWAQSREKDYVRQDSARFRVWYCPEDAKVVRDLWAELRMRIPLVESQLQLGLADTVNFAIAPDEREWNRLTAGSPLWANGITYAQRGIAVLKSPRFGLPYGPLPVTAIHEYVHLLLEAGAQGAEIPRWLNEGLAQVLAGQLNYMDDAVLARAAAAGRLHSLWRIEGMMGMNALEARQAYAESAVAVQFLQSRFGMAGIANLVHALRGGSPYEETFRTIFGISPGEFESQYQLYVRNNFRVSFFGDMDLWVPIAFVMLVGAAGLAVWLRRRRTVNRWREEDARERNINAGETVNVPPYTVNYTIVRGRLHESDNDTPPDENLPHDRPSPGN